MGWRGFFRGGVLKRGVRTGDKRAGVVLAVAPVFVWVFLAVETARGQDAQDAQDAQAVEQALRQAEEQHKEQAQVVAARRAEVSALEQEMAGLRSEAVSAERERRNLERQEISLRVALAVSAVESERLAVAVASERARGSAALSRLVFLAGRRPEAAAWHWDNPHQAARAVRLVGLIAGDSAGAAHRLEQNAVRVARLALQRRTEQEALRNTQAQQQVSATRLAEALAKRAVLVREAQGGLRDAEARVLAAGVKARDLRELLTALAREAESQKVQEAQKLAKQKIETAPLEKPADESAEEKVEKKARATPSALSSVTSASVTSASVTPAKEVAKPAPTRARAKAQEGVWSSPVFASPAVGFGEGAGIYGEGLVYQTEAGEVVAAPLGGEVVWASPFRGWGMLIIVEHAGDGASFHSLLAGATAAEVVVGQQVLAGEPLAQFSEAGRLYWELRVDGKPRDPAQYLGRAVAAR